MEVEFSGEVDQGYCKEREAVVVRRERKKSNRRTRKDNAFPKPFSWKKRDDEFLKFL